MNKVPKSAYEKVNGLVYFARMLDKIRLHARGELRADFHANLGKGGDGRCTDFLRVAYADLRERVLQGGSDEEILEWCFQQGRRLNDGDVTIWNQFATKLGWNDPATAVLQRFKMESGLSQREDIFTLFEYFEVDEGRKK
ncbi:DUF5069 domain-containing protein [Pedosphaera parvula]|uniref:DUF5069 domain-containing protein n=1 Tax=Pedosphaera parvula (strain Ellin514) TaxID=320771 RepID=B9XMG5_PEDPL|nr:DUF5069 domain-containing protein [Pedosphaera parvula]EEF59007.1 conserved hypothetical protein [Pedosphaera parvula Ellin514]